jgi:hypothetical protein
MATANQSPSFHAYSFDRLSSPEITMHAPTLHDGSLSVDAVPKILTHGRAELRVIPNQPAGLIDIVRLDKKPFNASVATEASYEGVKKAFTEGMAPILQLQKCRSNGLWLLAPHAQQRINDTVAVEILVAKLAAFAAMRNKTPG